MLFLDAPEDGGPPPTPSGQPDPPATTDSTHRPTHASPDPQFGTEVGSGWGGSWGTSPGRLEGLGGGGSRMGPRGKGTCREERCGELGGSDLGWDWGVLGAGWGWGGCWGAGWGVLGAGWGSGAWGGSLGATMGGGVQMAGRGCQGLGGVGVGHARQPPCQCLSRPGVPSTCCGSISWRPRT